MTFSSFTFPPPSHPAKNAPVLNFLASIVLALLICLIGNVSATVRSGTHNSVNQLGTLSPGGPVVVSGSLSKEAQALTISGAAVPLSGGRGFRKEVSVTPGLNRFPIVVTEANGTVTSKFIEMQVESGVAIIHTYDLNGNLESVAPQATPTQPLRSYKWDAADRLIEINRYLRDGGIEKTAYTYNGMGDRVGKTEFVDGIQQSNVSYLYGATGVLQERSAGGSTVLKTYTSEVKSITPPLRRRRVTTPATTSAVSARYWIVTALCLPDTITLPTA